MGIGELHYRSLSSVFFVLLLFRDWGGGKGIRGVSFFCVFYPYDLPSGPSDPTFAREGRSPEFDGVGWDGISKVSFKFLYTL